MRYLCGRSGSWMAGRGLGITRYLVPSIPSSTYAGTTGYSTSGHITLLVCIDMLYATFLKEEGLSGYRSMAEDFLSLSQWTNGRRDNAVSFCIARKIADDH